MSQIIVSGTNAARDEALLRSYFGPRAEGCELDRLSPQQADQLGVNKYAVLPYTGQAELPAGSGDSLIVAQARQQLHAMHRWQGMLASAIKLLEGLDVQYVLIKSLASPFARMSDIDFLVPYPHDIKRIVSELERANYALYRFRLLAHPLKIMAVPTEQSIKVPPAIDLYPDAMWVRKHVIDGAGVVARKQWIESRGVMAWCPTAEDDYYLVATHAFARGDVTLMELDHGFRLARQAGFNWDTLERMGRAFGCLDAVYAYSALLQLVSANLGYEADIPPPDFLRRLGAYRVNHPFVGWIKSLAGQLALPARIPLWLCTLRSGAYHLPAVANKLRASELVFDIASHGLAFMSHIMRRD